MTSIGMESHLCMECMINRVCPENCNEMGCQSPPIRCLNGKLNCTSNYLINTPCSINETNCHTDKLDRIVDCDDSDQCTADSYDQTKGICVHKKLNNCCTIDSDCPSDNCHDGSCLDGHCVKRAKHKEGCCTTHFECRDENECTLDFCLGNGTCSHVHLKGCGFNPQLLGECQCDEDCTVKGPPCSFAICDSFLCIYNDKDCSDDNECTIDTCNNKTSECVNTVIPNCCTTTEDCMEQVDVFGLNSTEKLGCMIVNCVKNQCVFDQSPCSDDNECTIDKCNNVTKQCDHTPIPNCCRSSDDCYQATDSNSTSIIGCMKLECLESKCQISGTAECYDDDPCTDDVCNNETKKCEHTPISNCCRFPSDCESGPDCSEPICSNNLCVYMPNRCDDGNYCTYDTCNNSTGKCTHTPIRMGGCCMLDEDCNREHLSCDPQTHICITEPIDPKLEDDCKEMICKNNMCQPKDLNCKKRINTK